MDGMFGGFLKEDPGIGFLGKQRCAENRRGLVRLVIGWGRRSFFIGSTVDKIEAFCFMNPVDDGEGNEIIAIVSHLFRN